MAEFVRDDVVMVDLVLALPRAMIDGGGSAKKLLGKWSTNA